MDKNTLNGFEVFEEFMPGSVINNNTSINDSDIIDGASEELTEEEKEFQEQLRILELKQVEEGGIACSSGSCAL